MINAFLMFLIHGVVYTTVLLYLQLFLMFVIFHDIPKTFLVRFAPCLMLRRSLMTEFNSSDAGPLGAGDGCVLPRDGKQVCSGRAPDGIFLSPKRRVCTSVDGVFFLFTDVICLFQLKAQRRYSGDKVAAASLPHGDGDVLPMFA